jgi:hypothetical protein
VTNAEIGNLISEGQIQKAICIFKVHLCKGLRMPSSSPQTSRISERDIYRRMRILMEIDEEAILQQVLPSVPKMPQNGRQWDIQLYDVKSYVMAGNTSGSGAFKGVIVPAFASHWAVVIGQFIYHLVFVRREDAALQFSDISRKGKPIRFSMHNIDLENNTEIKGEATLVGKTRYNVEMLTEIGKKLVEAFGDYHRLFWNCQTFAKLFLDIITEGGCQIPLYVYQIPGSF